MRLDGRGSRTRTLSPMSEHSVTGGIEVAAPGGAAPRASGRGVATRQALLDAAAEVFATKGYTAAGVTDVVNAAGASVGSLYHHFAGKADLFLTLYNEFQARQHERTRAATHTARDAGEADPMRVFSAGARAYIEGSIAERELSRLFLAGDGPPGFERLMRQGLRDWVDRNSALFEKSGGLDDALVIILTGAMVTTVSELARYDGPRDAWAFADRVLDIMARIPGSPADR